MGRTRELTTAAIAAFSILISIPASGADLATLPRKAPPIAVQGFSWSGIYLGGHVGYAVGTSEVGQSGFFGGLVEGTVDGLGSRGLSGGVLIGFNQMLAPRWVWGIEADGSWQGLKTTGSIGDTLIEIRQDWSNSVRARLGYLVTPATLFYATGGWAWSNVKVSHNIFGGIEAASAKTQGLQIGAGAETMLSANWLARIEYLHTFYDDATVAFPFDTALTLTPSVGVGRVALVYRFGDKAASSSWPQPASTPMWTGFYVGGMAGAIAASAKVEVPSFLTFVDGVGVSAALITGLAGYTHQLWERGVVGIEVEGAPAISTSDYEINWVTAVRGRLGYLVTPATMIYGSAGWLSTSLNTFTLAKSTPPLSIPNQRVNALQIGGGIESALTGGWSARADYQYAFANTINLTLIDDAGNPLPATAKAQGHSGRIGLVYRFGR